MITNALAPADQGHAHDVSLDDTFDFLNLDGSGKAFPIDLDLDAALDWFVDRAVIHHEGADRLRAQAAIKPSLAARDLTRVSALRGALREVAYDGITGQKWTSTDTVYGANGKAISEVGRKRNLQWLSSFAQSVISFGR